MKRRPPKPELGQAGASGEELGEQERQAEVQEGHGSHHQGVGSSLENRGKCHLSPRVPSQGPPSCPGRGGKAEVSQAPLLGKRGLQLFFFF